MSVDAPPLSAEGRELMQLWRRQLGGRARLAEERGPRPFAVISYRVRGMVLDQTIELRRLSLMALFDDRLSSGDLTTRLVGIDGMLEWEAVQFGGPQLSRFDKDLRLAPAAGGKGRRLDVASDLAATALHLERYLERCARHPYFPRRRVPQLPTVRLVHGTPYVDLAGLPKRQVIALDDPAVDLCGSVGSTRFDFYHTRFHVAD